MEFLSSIRDYSCNIYGEAINYINEERVLQPLWDHMRLEYGEFCRSPLFPVVLNVGFYFLINIPFMTIDLMGKRWPRFYKYKIQQKEVARERMFEAFIHTIRNNVLFILPAAIYQWMYRPPNPLLPEAPTIAEFLLGMLGNILLFDFQYYWWHRLHHTYRGLYKYVHKIHHEHKSPCSWTTQYLSAPELLAVGIFSSVNPIILNQHFLTTNICMLWNVYFSIEAHVGYDFPWSFGALLPFGLWGGPIKHDMHHVKPRTNFQPFFTYLDKIFGTDSDAQRCEKFDPLKRQKKLLHDNLKKRKNESTIKEKTIIH